MRINIVPQICPHLYKNFLNPYTLAEVFETTDGVYGGFRVSEENEFRQDLDDVVVATVRERTGLS